MSAVLGALDRVDDVPTGQPSPACPRCGTTGSLPITYGYPTPELIRSALRGEVALGGAVHSGELPAFECRDESCGHTWGRAASPEERAT